MFTYLETCRTEGGLAALPTLASCLPSELTNREAQDLSCVMGQRDSHPGKQGQWGPSVHLGPHPTPPHCPALPDACTARLQQLLRACSMCGCPHLSTITASGLPFLSCSKEVTSVPRTGGLRGGSAAQPYIEPRPAQSGGCTWLSLGASWSPAWRGNGDV